MGRARPAPQWVRTHARAARRPRLTRPRSRPHGRPASRRPQAQDDYLDCFGTPEQIGKIGTDIQDKKCGWLFAHAYHELCSPEQKKFLDTVYGKCKVDSPEEKQVKELYKQIGLPELYEKYEKESYERIMQLKGTTKQVPWSVFDIFLKKIYKRSK